ncbi:hypothetical protein SUDANB176_06689 [Streptomyces sp. enrichment culture]
MPSRRPGRFTVSFNGERLPVEFGAILHGLPNEPIDGGTFDGGAVRRGGPSRATYEPSEQGAGRRSGSLPQVQAGKAGHPPARC